MPSDSFDEQSRREFMKKAGKLAIYTPPALMILMRPTPNAIAESAGYFQHTDENKDGNLVGEAPEHDHTGFSLDR
jgi:hypothetical protein